MKILILKQFKSIAIIIAIISSSIATAQVENLLDVYGNGQVHGKFTADSLHIKNIEIGNSLFLGGVLYSANQEIFTDAGNLLLQSNTNYPYKYTLINARSTFSNNGFSNGGVGIGLGAVGNTLENK